MTPSRRKSAVAVDGAAPVAGAGAAPNSLASPMRRARSDCGAALGIGAGCGANHCQNQCASVNARIATAPIQTAPATTFHGQGSGGDDAESVPYTALSPTDYSPSSLPLNSQLARLQPY